MMKNSRHVDSTPRLRGRKAVAQRLRRLKRTAGLCEMCRARGIIRLATVVDHVIPLSRGGLDVDENCRNLCDEHNRIVTAEQLGDPRSGWTVGQSGLTGGLDAGDDQANTETVGPLYCAKP